MHSSLLEKFGLSPATLPARGLLTRAPSDPPVFFCDGYESHPAAYTFTLGSVAGAVCQAFVYGAEQAGKTQVVRQNVPTVNKANAIALFKYTWKSAQWATATTCGVAMSYGINTACEKIEDDSKGQQPATRGFRESYGNDCDASMEVDAA
ncbi:hypothetical protein Slin15195_G035810 [Septoria linicola]|uniref:Uncharacterized protein n=1 Tax=Septoria linicola TaxID=215465 RepID=A0A9Q9AQK0_9PEZI|nr:hypothetical protein Slin14017_G117170 [Septoria linicola]USW50262.1 hypothetical protein Slin15195_G035810 [Septoria linicola]